MSNNLLENWNLILMYVVYYEVYADISSSILISPYTNIMVSWYVFKKYLFENVENLIFCGLIG